ncbi:MAG: SulP family inorganic anion transporter [Thermodesulfobacteriota bacterium]
MNAADKMKWPTVFSGLKGGTRTNLPREISAGITLAALIIPLNIGYAQVAGLPPVFGLYAGIFPLAVFALFTGSRHVVGSPDATIAAILGAALIGFAPIGDPLRVDYALALSLLCGVLFIAFWFFRLAFLANFLSRAVLAGFISGLAIEVFTNQVRKILGVSHTKGVELGAIGQQIHDAMTASLNTTGYFAELILLIKSIPHANLYSVAVGAGAFLIVRLMKKYAPMAPAALIALMLTTVVASLLGLDQKGVKVLGSIPSGLPSLTVPRVPLSDYVQLFPGAMAVVAITLCKGLLLVRDCSRKNHTKADGNQVLFAYGMSSIASGFTGSLVSGPSSSRTAAMDAAGSRTQISSLAAAVTVALVMMFLTDALASLPIVALAGVVASAVLSMIEIDELREFWHTRRSEFWIASICLFCVLGLGPLRAVIIAFLLSTIDLVRRASRPGTWLLYEAPDGSYFIPEKTDHIPADSEIIIYRFGASLYFANATLFEEEVEQLITRASLPVKWFVLDAQALNDIDTTGEDVLHQIFKWLTDRGVTVAVSHASPSTLALLKKYHLLDLIGENRTYPSNRHAIAAYRRETGQVVAPPAG